mgnify:CR=1 FL=1
MKYLPNHLKMAYEYDLKNTPDIKEISHPLINVSDILQAHYILADYFTDESSGVPAEKMLAGLRSSNLLYSAICRQTVSNGNKFKYTNPLAICATLFFGLTKDHPFHDGNKRTALLVLIKQLTEYGYYPIQSINAFESLVESVAESSLPTKYGKIYKKFKKYDDPVVETIAFELKRITEKKDRSLHLNLNMKEFCNILSENNGVIYELDNMKIKFKRKVKKFLSVKELSYTVKFYGWTRPVEAGMARDTFDKLQLTDEFSSFNRLLAGEKSFYSIINQFEMPLRRLKDK